MNLYFSSKSLAILFLALILGLTACSSDPCGSKKEQFVKNYTTFYEGLKSTDEKSVWEDKDRTLQKFIKECYPKYKMELAVMQHKDFWFGVVKYYNTRYGMEAMGRIMEVKEFINYLKDSNLNIVEVFKSVTGGLF